MENKLAIDCTIEHQTKKAVLIDDGTQQIWLPKSVVEIDRSEDGKAVVYVPTWLANERELI
jgi:hypothetical protein